MSANESIVSAPAIMRLADVAVAHVEALLARWQLRLVPIAPDMEIPGSYWGESEAGLSRDVIYARRDTPLQSLLHEACHYVCMDAARRAQLQRDAGGDYDEENAVCYLQIVVADHIPGFGRDRMLADMDAWGYTFRLGSARAWFEQEADDARAWLIRADVLDAHGQPTWRVRQ